MANKSISSPSWIARCGVALLAGAASAQSAVEWSATAPNPASNYDFGYAIAAAPDGSVYIASLLPSFTPFNVPQTDGLLTKFSPSGLLEWTASWDTYGFGDYVADVAIDANGDVYVCGAAYDALNYDGIVRKYSSGGAPLWSAAVPASGTTTISFRKLAFLSNGDVVAVGARQFSTQIACFSSSGARLWSDTDGGGFGGSQLVDVVVSAQDEILACGRKGTNFNGALAVYKYASNGVLLWSTLVDENVAQQSSANALTLATRGKLVAAGYAQIGQQQEDALLAQVDLATGAVDWTLYVDTGGTGFDELRDVGVDAEGVVWAAGRQSDASNEMSSTVLRASPTGQLLTSATWPGGAGAYDQAQSLHLGSAGQAWVLVVNGLSGRDIVLLQYDSQGSLSSQTSVDLGAGSDDIGSVSALAPDGRLVVGGSTNATAAGDYDVLALQFDLNDAPTGYCTAKVNSLGCSPTIAFVGASSAGATSGFAIRCSNVRNQKNGLLLYGLNGASGAPFQGGQLCVQPPLRRTVAQSSAGSTAGDDCSGVFSFDMNAFAAGASGGNPAPELVVVGSTVHCQQWSRDPGALGGSGMSSGLRYVVQL